MYIYIYKVNMYVVICVEIERSNNGAFQTWRQDSPRRGARDSPRRGAGDARWRTKPFFETRKTIGKHRKIRGNHEKMMV